MADESPLTHANPRVAPDEVWARVQADYVGGLPASEACRRHGVGLTALRNRAAREGWRRSDQPWTPPNRLHPDDEGALLEAQVCGDLDQVEMRELSFIAQRRMMRAVLRGDASEALRWRRVRIALHSEAFEMDDLFAQEEANWQMHGSAHAAAEADPVDSTDGVSTGG